MGHTLYSQIGLALLLFCCGLALWKGGRAERWGAVIILAANVCADALVSIMQPHYPYFAEFLVDLALAIGLLVVAIRFTNVWLGVAMFLQSIGLGMYALESGGDGLPGHAYLHWMNILTVLMLLSILTGTIGAWRRRWRAGRAGTPAVSLGSSPFPTSGDARRLARIWPGARAAARNPPGLRAQ